MSTSVSRISRSVSGEGAGVTGAGAGLGMVGGAFGFHDRLHQGLSVQPAPGEIRNMEILGYTQLRGRAGQKGHGVNHIISNMCHVGIDEFLQRFWVLGGNPSGHVFV